MHPFLADVSDPVGMPLLEAVLWAVPLFLSAHAFGRQRAGGRFGWFVVALACFVIVLDKTIDLYTSVLHLGREVVSALDPAHHFRGETMSLRLLLLGGLFLAGALGLAWLVRWDRRMGRAKWTSLLGLVLVMALLGLRLLPWFAGAGRGWIGKAFEGVTWLLVMGGAVAGCRAAVDDDDGD